MSPNITEILGRSKQGVTRPFICRCDNDLIYFVKGLDATRESQVKEWVAGCLANELGLPIAPFSLVNADPAFAGEPIYNGLGSGYSFGSQKAQVTEISYSDIIQVPEYLQLEVLAFDWWINNNDRTLSELGGNPNLFWEPQRSELVVIDQNQAFDPNFSKCDFLDYHIFKDRIPVIFNDFVRRDEFSDRFVQALTKWDEICEKIPESWMFLDEDMLVRSSVNISRMKQTLDKVHNQDFWDLSSPHE